jgi:predicted nucleic acid-binding Zn ribbon protein
MAKKINKNIKYCPQCGTPNEVQNRYCIRCGYEFYKKKNKLGLKQILIIIITLTILWCAVRIILNKPIIPDLLKELLNIKEFPKLNILENTSKNNTFKINLVNFSNLSH